MAVWEEDEQDAIDAPELEAKPLVSMGKLIKDAQIFRLLSVPQLPHKERRRRCRKLEPLSGGEENGRNGERPRFARNLPSGLPRGLCVASGDLGSAPTQINRNWPRPQKRTPLLRAVSAKSQTARGEKLAVG